MRSRTGGTGTKKARMYAEIGENLQRIFPKARGVDPVALSKKVHRLEVEAHRAATDYCNGRRFGRPYGTEDFDRDSALVLAKLDKILGFRAAGVPVFVNGDCRGYALKIEEGAVRG